MNDYSFLDPSIDRRLAVDIDRAEDDELEAYLDTTGHWTIGRGHLMPPPGTPAGWKGFTIIQSTSDRYFNDDLLKAIVLAQKWAEFAKCDTPCRQNALIEIAFNLGGKFEGFHKTRAAIMAQDWQGAHDNLLWNAPGVKTDWYKEVEDRAERIANYFLTGEYPSQE